MYHGIIDADYNRTGDVSLDHSYDWTSYCTHHSDMDDPQYVQVDVPSDVADSWMFYYTHHSDMDGPQYAHDNVHSGAIC